MILGRFLHPASACFDEIDAAVRAMTDRVVAMNAHAFPPPPGGIVYNMEDPRLVPDAATRWSGHEVWDAVEANAARNGATYVPIGYHPSMERFAPLAEPEIDIAFTGIVTPRRADVLNELRSRGLNVVYAPPPSYGKARNSLYARARLVLDILSFEDGLFSSVRCALLAANRIPVLSERCEGTWDFVPSCTYDEIVDRAIALVNRSPEERRAAADVTYEAFTRIPMVLPQ